MSEGTEYIHSSFEFIFLDYFFLMYLKFLIQVLTKMITALVTRLREINRLDVLRPVNHEVSWTDGTWLFFSFAP